jgi:iron complex transport system substrate-binding protein
LVRSIHADLDAAAQRHATRSPARVLVLTGPLSEPPTQPTAAGPGSFYDDLLRRAGHVNAAAASNRSFAPLSLEFVLQADPDVIIELVPDAESRPHGDDDARRIWAQVGPLRAVAEHRVHALVGAQYFLLSPRIAETFEALCRLVDGATHE